MALVKDELHGLDDLGEVVVEVRAGAGNDPEYSRRRAGTGNVFPIVMAATRHSQSPSTLEQERSSCREQAAARQEE